MGDRAKITGGGRVVPDEKAMTRAALYVRVSTKEQTTENQELELRRWAEGLGFQVDEVLDEEVGRRSGAQRALGHRRCFVIIGSSESSS